MSHGFSELEAMRASVRRAGERLGLALEDVHSLICAGKLRVYMAAPPEGFTWLSEGEGPPLASGAIPDQFSAAPGYPDNAEGPDSLRVRVLMKMLAAASNRLDEMRRQLESKDYELESHRKQLEDRTREIERLHRVVLQAQAIAAASRD